MDVRSILAGPKWPFYSQLCLVVRSISKSPVVWSVFAGQNRGPYKRLDCNHLEGQWPYRTAVGKRAIKDTQPQIYPPLTCRLASFTNNYLEGKWPYRPAVGKRAIKDTQACS